MFVNKVHKRLVHTNLAFVCIVYKYSLHGRIVCGVRKTVNDDIPNVRTLAVFF